MKTLGIITARAGSKRLPGKNLALLAGKPLIAHTCAAALESGALDAIFVNTDCQRIADAATRAGATCPALRPVHLAQDDTPTRDAVIWMLDFLSQRDECYDTLMLLQPTSPLRSAADIRASMRLFQLHAPCSVISVSPTAPAAWHARLDSSDRISRLSGNDPLMRVNGAIYIHRVADYIASKPTPDEIAYVMPPQRGVDIDTYDDLEFCEFLLGKAINAPNASLAETLK